MAGYYLYSASRFLKSLIKDILVLKIPKMLKCVLQTGANKLYLLENNDTKRRMHDDVFTGRDKGRRRMSYHSSLSLDVTLHLFISALNAGSKGEGVSKGLELEISSDTKYRSSLVKPNALE